VADYLVQEDGSSRFILEDSSGDLLLETSSATPSVSAPFIPSVTALYTPGGFFPLTFDASGSFTVPPGVTQIYVIAWGGGGGSASSTRNGGQGGGGGGAMAAGFIPVSPGATYTVTVGAPGAPDGDGGSSSVVGDGGTSVVAVGGKTGVDPGTAGAGGLASACTGTATHSGGTGGAGNSTPGSGGAGGGGGAGRGADGGVGGAPSGINSGAAGLGGSGGGGNGGVGGQFSSILATNGTLPAGGAGGNYSIRSGGASGGGGRVIVEYGDLVLAGIPSVTQVFTPTVKFAGFTLPFIASHTSVKDIFSVFSHLTGTGPGIAGEQTLMELAPHGTSQTATLAATIGTGTGPLSLTGDSGLPSGSFCLQIGSEVLYVTKNSPGSYTINQRALSNTVAASHTSGATATWHDYYDMPLTSAATIAASFSADILGSGSTAYGGWLIAFDSSQAYIGASRYPMHVTSFLGVFPAGTGSTGVNRMDAAQSNATCIPAAVSDNCPAAISVPSRIATTIAIGDVGLVRYQNPSASMMQLGPRSCALQSWYGLKRVDAADNDVTTTNPSGNIVDGAIEAAFFNPSLVGEDPATGNPSDRPIAYTSTTLLGSSRSFTHGGTPSPPNFNEKGWPLGCLAVRQETKRVPYWQAYDWKNYNYTYCGFGTDNTFAQIVVNENGIVFGTSPIVSLPGSQDIKGPDAMWDDGNYYFATAWAVLIFQTPYLVVGPSIGGNYITPPTDTSVPGPVPGVSFDSGGAPTLTVPGDSHIGGSGGGIPPGGIIPPSPPPMGQRFWATMV
jgi:hypothetical protein